MQAPSRSPLTRSVNSLSSHAVFAEGADMSVVEPALEGLRHAIRTAALDPVSRSSVRPVPTLEATLWPRREWARSRRRVLLPQARIPSPHPG